MYKLGETTSEEAVAQLSARLWKAKIPHQVVAKGSDSEPLSEIWLVREADLPLAVEILKQPESNKQAMSMGKSPLIASLRYAKVTWFFLILCAVVAFITGLGRDFAFTSWFTIVPITLIGNTAYPEAIEDTLRLGEYWRLFSPALLHLSVLHLVFNLLWVWEFGRRIEVLEGALRLTLLILMSGVLANIAQYYVGSILFGGMSGVIYALLGYMVVIDKLSVQPIYKLPKGIVGFMLVWLVLGYTQFTELLGMGRIANAAHTAGLFSGVGLALLVRLIYRSRFQSVNH